LNENETNREIKRMKKKYFLVGSVEMMTRRCGSGNQKYLYRTIKSSVYGEKRNAYRKYRRKETTRKTQT
jgi:hypothetical protein